MTKWTLDVFKDMYYYELNAKESIHARVSVPLGTLSIIVTLIVYYLSESKALPPLSWMTRLLIIYYGLTITIIGLVVYSSVMLYRIVYGNKYGQLPPPAQIQEYMNNLQKTNNTEETNQKEFHSFLNDMYRDAAEENRKNNHIKIGYIRNANLAIILALLLCIINSVPLYFIK